MKLTFVGHASVLLETRDVGILMDPWLKGFAFNESWALHPEPFISDDAWSRVTHIWISHEHPDHLSIPTLKAIPPERRRGITALFQRHYSRTVHDFLASLGFADVVELDHAKWRPLASGVEIYCRQIGHTDSCLAVRDGNPNGALLNLNDCQTPPTTLQALRRDVGCIHLLLDQFSIAGWAGNPDDHERKRAAARRALDAFVRDFTLLEPRWMLPFASFVRFCHPSNAHMNEHINTIDDVARRIPEERLVVMYPGDTWELDTPFSGTRSAMERYRQDYARIEDLPLHRTPRVAFDTILDAAEKRIADIAAHYHWPLRRWVPPVAFRLADLGRAFEVSLQTGVREVKTATAVCTVRTDSQAAWYTFAHRWGLPTLGVSGRYALEGDERPFLRLKKLGSAYAAGIWTRQPGQGLLGVLGPAGRSRYLWDRRHDLISQFLGRMRLA